MMVPEPLKLVIKPDQKQVSAPKEEQTPTRATRCTFHVEGRPSWGMPCGNAPPGNSFYVSSRPLP
jgi:hypothetical protein